LFEGGPSPAGQPDPIGGSASQRFGQLLPSPADGIDVQPGDLGEEAIAAMADLGRFDGGVPAALLLIESAHQEIHPAMDLLVGMRFGAGTGGALTRMDITLGHGLTFPEVSSESMSSYQKPGT
jgi:hypothetical protein